MYPRDSSQCPFPNYDTGGNTTFNRTKNTVKSLTCPMVECTGHGSRASFHTSAFSRTGTYEIGGETEPDSALRRPLIGQTIGPSKWEVCAPIALHLNADRSG
jgi:hypothetical protein